MCSCRWKSCWFDSSGTLSQRLAATDLNHNDAHTNPQEVVCLRVRACVFLLIQVPSCFCFGCILLSSFTSRVRVFLAEVVSLPVFSLDTVAASYPRMHFTLSQRLNGGASFFPPGTAGRQHRGSLRSAKPQRLEEAVTQCVFIFFYFPNTVYKRWTQTPWHHLVSGWTLLWNLGG